MLKREIKEARKAFGDSEFKSLLRGYVEKEAKEDALTSFVTEPQAITIRKKRIEKFVSDSQYLRIVQYSIIHAYKYCEQIYSFAWYLKTLYTGIYDNLCRLRRSNRYRKSCNVRQLSVP